MTERRFRFGIVTGHAPDVQGFAALARRAEELGYDTLVTSDPMNGNDPLTTLSAVAAVTTRLRFGTFVVAAPFRDSRMLAWQARTLHTLSGGRFELGIGVGRPGAERHAATLGREFGSGARRLEQLTEVVTELKRHTDRPRLLLAGSGPKLLALAGREADLMSITWSPRTTEAEADAAVTRFRATAGERAGDIELNLNLIAVGDEPAPWVERYIGATARELADTGAVTVLPGAPEQAADTLRRWRERWGTSYITVNAGFVERFAPVVAKLSGE